MSNIAEVIGWKFPGQQGMSTLDGVITAFADGSIPSQSDQDAWTAEYDIYKAAMDEIERLESEVTQRRLRDAYADSTWMDAQEALIAVERAKL
jgi:hypothetical protein